MQTIAPVNQTFLSNMARLWRTDPKLALRVDEVPVEATLPVERSKSGPMTARIETADGRRLYMHSRYDPIREANDFCKGLQANEALCFVLFGLGLGYHLKALFEQFGDEIVVVVCEPDLVTLKSTLEHTDLSAELGTGRVKFLTSVNKAILHERLSRHSTMIMLGTCFVAPPAFREHHADFHTTLRNEITDFVAFARMSLVTLVKNAAITCRNIANNLPTYVTTPPPDIVRNRFQGVPAILVAAGPSLNRNIGQLRELQDRAVIIAAQTTVKPLLAQGVRPHFVTTLDYSDMSKQFFENVDIPNDTILVAEPKASWHVIDAFLKASRSRPTEQSEAPPTHAEQSEVPPCHAEQSEAPPCHAERSEASQPLDSGTTSRMISGEILRSAQNDTNNPQPSTPNSQPSTLNSQPSTLNPQPSTPNPQPSSPHPLIPSTPSPPRVLMLFNDFAQLCLGRDLAERTPMEAGSTVMHLAFYLAQWLGCDPIIFIGQDLGFTGHTYYAPGVTMHRAWQPELGRFGTLEMKEWERIARNRKILKKTIDVHGREIYTDEQMFTYLQQFERDFANCAAQVIDATEGGARKTGTTVMPLSEAAARYCIKPLDPPSRSRLPGGTFRQDSGTTPAKAAPGDDNPTSNPALEASPPLLAASRIWWNPSRLKPARDMLARRRQSLDVFRQACEETRTILRELETLVDDPPRFNRRIMRVDELRTLVQQQHEIFKMVSMVAQLGELQKFSADRRVSAGNADESLQTRRRLQRDRRFIDALLDGCDEMGSILNEALGRFGEALAELSQSG